MSGAKISDLAMLTMAEASALVGKKEVSPVELTKECLDRIQEKSGDLVCYVTVLQEQALEDAKKAEAEIVAGGQKSPLHGIPFALKDIYCTKGVLTSAGSPFFSDYYPDFDSTVGRRLAAAGGILLGKTNTSEWALTIHSRSYFGQSRNPWNPERAPGGSSGGSAIAVAAGMAYMAMGSDTGCSIRLPAAFCGVAGFKPSYGLVSLYGIVPLSYSMDHAGPIGRSVMDLALTMDLISGFDPLDLCSDRGAHRPAQFAAELLKTKDLKGRVIGVPGNFFFDRADSEVEELVLKAIDKLKDLGAKVEYLEIPHMDWIPEVSSKILFAEAAHFHKERLASRPELFGEVERQRLERGRAATAVELVDALRKREIIRRAWEEAAAKVDAVAVPTTPIAAFKLGCDTVTVKGIEEPCADMAVRHCRMGTTLGVPGLTVPVGINSEGMPVGMMLMSNRYRDLEVLKVGWAYEQANPFPLLGAPQNIRPDR